MRVLVIGGIEIPLKSSHDLTQSYEPVQAVNRVRMMDGSLKQQTAWNGKLLTSMSGGGLIPAGIQSLDYTNAVIIKCIAERTVTSATNVIVVPANRRADYGVEGKALLNGKWQSTPVSLAGNIATLTIVAGATQYQAVYWPELTCFLDPPSEQRDARRSVYGWTLTAEEI